MLVCETHVCLHQSGSHSWFEMGNQYKMPGSHHEMTYASSCNSACRKLNFFLFYTKTSSGAPKGGKVSGQQGWSGPGAETADSPVVRLLAPSCFGGERGNPLPYSCLENPHGQRSLAGYSPRGRRVGHYLATMPPPPLSCIFPGSFQCLSSPQVTRSHCY